MSYWRPTRACFRGSWALGLGPWSETRRGGAEFTLAGLSSAVGVVVLVGLLLTGALQVLDPELLELKPLIAEPIQVSGNRLISFWLSPDALWGVPSPVPTSLPLPSIPLGRPPRPAPPGELPLFVARAPPEHNSSQQPHALAPHPSLPAALFCPSRPALAFSAYRSHRPSPRSAPLRRFRSMVFAASFASPPLVALAFPRFADGRGDSSARLLRDRLGSTGELRAVGHVLPDQVFYVRRVGFDSLALAEGKSTKTAIAQLETFSVRYQAAADDSRRCSPA